MAIYKKNPSLPNKGFIQYLSGDESAMLLHQRHWDWTFFLKLQNFLVPEQKIHSQIKALRGLGWTLKGLAILQTLVYQPCIAQHVFPKKEYFSSNPSGSGFVPRTSTPSPFPTPSQVEQHKDMPELTMLCQNLSSAHSQRAFLGYLGPCLSIGRWDVSDLALSLDEFHPESFHQ